MGDLKESRFNIWFLIMLLSFIAVSFYVESFYNTMRSNEIAYKASREETVLVDRAGILSPEEMKSIKEQGKRLSVYNIGMYIAYDCTEEQTEFIAINMCYKLLPINDGIMVVLSVDDAGINNYSVYYNLKGNVSERMIQILMDKFKTRFGVDSGWATTTFNELVSYLKIIEDNRIDTYETLKNAEPFIQFNRLFLVIVICYAVYVFYYLKYKLPRQFA